MMMRFVGRYVAGLWLSFGHLATYARQQWKLWEVLERLQSTLVQADELKLGKLLEVCLVVGGQTLDCRLVEDQVIELIDTGTKKKS